MLYRSNKKDKESHLLLIPFYFFNPLCLESSILLASRKFYTTTVKSLQEASPVGGGPRKLRALHFFLKFAVPYELWRSVDYSAQRSYLSLRAVPSDL
jgi:hypothetical protein